MNEYIMYWIFNIKYIYIYIYIYNICNDIQTLEQSNIKNIPTILTIY